MRRIQHLLMHTCLSLLCILRPHLGRRHFPWIRPLNGTNMHPFMDIREIIYGIDLYVADLSRVSRACVVGDAGWVPPKHKTGRTTVHQRMNHVKPDAKRKDSSAKKRCRDFEQDPSFKVQPPHSTLQPRDFISRISFKKGWRR
jgi:hypothetical protein